MDPIPFSDRADAGRKLAVELVSLDLSHPLVLALPRGGVPVASEVAASLPAPMDILVVRKVGAPINQEVAMAAVVEGEPPTVTLNPPVLRVLGLDPEDIADDIAREIGEMERRVAAYRQNRPRMPLAGRDVIIVDDGLATGTSLRAAIEAVRRQNPHSVGVAIPVASPAELIDIRRLADWTVCLLAPEYFTAVGAYYVHFDQLSDAEVIACLNQKISRQPPYRSDISNHQPTLNNYT